MAILENKPSAEWKAKASRRKWLAIGFTCLPAWLCSYLATEVFKEFAFGLFIWLPIVIGASSTLLYGYRFTTERKRIFGVSLLTLSIFSAGLLLFAWEGIICLMMAFPLAFAFMLVGHFLAMEILKSNLGNGNTLPILLFLTVPALLAFEERNSTGEELRSVTTSIEINASPEVVWQNVIAFPTLDNPSEFIFKTGIAYPIDATINGKGVGAVRHCNFSTGSFVEPITVWNEPSLLKFSVNSQPATMKELSIYDIQPNHLHGYWQSKQGQFELVRLPNGGTRLVGTTWYINKIKPSFYWTLWSDYIVHKIHFRVLAHIKQQAESKDR